MKTIKGDLIKLAQAGEFDVIIHGCNCFCTMGAGIAKQIKKEFPRAYRADLQTQKGDRSKLGTYSVFHNTTTGLRVINAYTQYGYGRGQNHADYEAIRQIFRHIALKFRNQRIGYPAIGAGHAGGDWNIISAIIDEELAGLDHTLVLL